jgi:cob(I)alamin adenosyltransferase
MQQENDGFLFVYTGEGSGPCTATIGHALRAMAAGQRVFIAQFDRCGWEAVLTLIQRISDAIVCRRYTHGETFVGEPNRDEIQDARQGLNEVGQALRSGDYSPVILDGANRAVCFGLFSVTDLLALIDQKPKNVQLVITGACADPQIIQRADQVIEMNPLKPTPPNPSPFMGGSAKGNFF